MARQDCVLYACNYNTFTSRLNWRIKMNLVLDFVSDQWERFVKYLQSYMNLEYEEASKEADKMYKKCETLFNREDK